MIRVVFAFLILTFSAHAAFAGAGSALAEKNTSTISCLPAPARSIEKQPIKRKRKKAKFGKNSLGLASKFLGPFMAHVHFLSPVLAKDTLEG